LLISTGSADYLPAAEAKRVLADETGAGEVAVRAGTQGEGHRLAYFDITIGCTRVHLTDSLHAVEKAYGPIDPANLRVFRGRFGGGFGFGNSVEQALAEFSERTPRRTVNPLRP